MQPQTSSSYFRLIFILLFVMLFVVFMYTFLHEGGHALVGLLFGETLMEFNINFWNLSAHVDMVGGNLTRTQAAIQAAAGVSLPLLIWALFIGLVPRSPSFTLRVLKLLSSMMVLNTLLAWIIIPILYLFGSGPSSDDVPHFLQASGIPPLLLTGIAILLYILGWVYFLSNVEHWKDEFLLFRMMDRGTVLSGARLTIPVMIGILMFCAAMAFLMNNLGAATPFDQVSPPAGFAPIAEIDLSTRVYSFESLTRFSLEETTHVGVYIVIHDINTTYFDLCVIGSNGYNSVVLHGEGYSTNRDGGLWEADLSPGTYQLVLTSDQSPGTAFVFLKTY